MILKRCALGLALAIALLGGSVARAQQPATLLPAAATGQPAWSFNVAPYLWLPQVNTSLNYTLPANLGGNLPTSVSSGPGDYLPNLKFGAMLTAEARYESFSLVTDVIYTNVGLSQTNIRALNFVGLPSQPLTRSLETGTSSTLQATIWTLAGGVTVVQGAWGNLDVLAGFRLADIDARTDYNLALTVTGPRGNGATFGGSGTVGAHADIWNGIAGVRGGINLADSGFYIPYYLDIGGGGSDLTWQIATGIGYHQGPVSVTAQYRQLVFEQGATALVHRLSLGGPMLSLALSF